MRRGRAFGLGLAAFVAASTTMGFAVVGSDGAAEGDASAVGPTHLATEHAMAPVSPRIAALVAAAAQEANVPYDGKFTFVRVRTDQGGRNRGGLGGFGRRRGRGQPGWAHDYPRAERNFEKILAATTKLDTYMEGSNILTFDDPELFKFPIAYVSEPGEWLMSEEEEESLRNYFLKGGFVIFDDFRGWDFENFSAQLARVLPTGQLIDLATLSPPPEIFNSFFEITDPEKLTSYGGGPPQYYGIFEDNDPSKRLMLIANYNNDHGDYWEFSDAGWLPIDLTNEAYKFGVNYIVYAMTH